MNWARRLQVVQDAADEAWLEDEAKRAGVPINEARLILGRLDAVFASHHIEDGALLSPDTIALVAHDFALADASDEDPAIFVADLLRYLLPYEGRTEACAIAQGELWP
jgi:hypothetical protein